MLVGSQTVHYQIKEQQIASAAAPQYLHVIVIRAKLIACMNHPTINSGIHIIGPSSPIIRIIIGVRVRVKVLGFWVRARVRVKVMVRVRFTV